ncbi:MAG: hypothetical protein KAG19_00515 [Methylococcales bacterium]|nr:hypothetical protein [Methylococcales bacterium]
MDNVEDSSSFLLINVGAPFLIGMAVGYFVKKMLKIALFIFGMFMVFLLVTAHYGFIEINDANLTNAVQDGTSSINQFGTFLIDSLSGYKSIAASGVAGFFVGLKMG